MHIRNVRETLFGRSGGHIYMIKLDGVYETFSEYKLLIEYTYMQIGHCGH